jgi:hypothetical protein
MGFLLTVVGALLLLSSLAGVALGLFMALDRRTREPGIYFALWWTPAAAAAGGVLMGDSATFAVGASCFVIAGVAFVLERRSSRRRSARGKGRGPRNAGNPPLSEEEEAAERRSSEEAQTRK